jgi:hypothetical protein
VYVRNHLREHPEGKDSSVTRPTFGSSGEAGPQIKGARVGSQAGRWVDPGLYRNSETLRTELQRFLASTSHANG